MHEKPIPNEWQFSYTNIEFRDMISEDRLENPMALIQDNPWIICSESFNYRIDLTEEMVIAACAGDGFILEYIQNQTEAIQLAAVKNCELAIKWADNPSEKVQLEAIKKYTYVYQYIKSPTKKVQKLYMAKVLSS